MHHIPRGFRRSLPLLSRKSTVLTDITAVYRFCCGGSRGSSRIGQVTAVGVFVVRRGVADGRLTRPTAFPADLECAKRGQVVTLLEKTPWPATEDDHH